MSEVKPPSVAVLGAGMTGLAAAVRLAERGANPTILEAADRVGGLVATIPYQGRCFDYGPHGFAVYSAADQPLLDFFTSKLDGQVVSADKFVQIKFRGQLFDYPLKPMEAARQLGPAEAAACGASYAAEAIRRAIRPRPLLTAEDFFVSNYGRKLYRTFFEHYTAKVWGRHPSKLSARFLLKRMPRRSIFAAILASLATKRQKESSDPDEVPFHLHWHYPKTGGSGTFPTAMAADIESNGGRVLLSRRAIAVKARDDGGYEITYESPDGRRETLDAGAVVSTISITDLAHIFSGPDPAPPTDALVFRAVLIACIATKRRDIFPPQNIYFQNRLFNRVAEITRYSPENAPPDRDGLSAEMTCDVGDQLWNRPDEDILEQVISELVEEEVITRDDVEGGMLLRYPHGYPVYLLGYEKQLLPLRRYFAGQPRLYVAGRQGLYSYAQMHFCVRAGFSLADHLLSGEDKPAEPEDSETLLFV